MIHYGVQPSPRDENYKVRDVKYDRQLGRLVTLTTNGAVQLWDPHLSPIRTVRTRLALLAVVWRCLYFADLVRRVLESADAIDSGDENPALSAHCFCS